MTWPGERQRHSLSARRIRTAELLRARGMKYSKFPSSFWIITKPGTYSHPGDILIETDLAELTKEINKGTLRPSDIIGAYTDMDDARDDAIQAVENELLRDISWEDFAKKWNLNYYGLEQLAERLDYESPADMIVSMSPQSLFRGRKEDFVAAVMKTSTRKVKYVTGSKLVGVEHKLKEDLE